jgi:hypothetical protein
MIDLMKVQAAPGDRAYTLRTRQDSCTYLHATRPFTKFQDAWAVCTYYERHALLGKQPDFTLFRDREQAERWYAIIQPIWGKSEADRIVKFPAREA